MKYPVISSKAARNDYNKIVQSHADMVQGMAQQAQRVSQLNRQKQNELAQRQSMEGEMKKAQLVADTTTQKNAQDFQLKQAELDIRRSALTL